LAQDLQGLLGRYGVGYVAEVHATHELFGAHVDEELPEGLALDLRVEVPDSVDDGGGGEVYDALLRPEPPELAVARDPAPECAHAFREGLQGSPTTSGAIDSIAATQISLPHDRW
jgi:hypothetical protein